MVSRTSLNKYIASLIGVNKHQVDRNGFELQKAGIIKSKGRGRSAFEMEFEDVKNILFAVMGSNSPKEAPETVLKLDQLVDKEGNAFGQTCVEIFSNYENFTDVAAITINRSFPEATVVYQKIDEEAEVQKGEPWERVFHNPENKSEAPRLRVEATLDARSIQTIFYLIKYALG